jgi:hypothetical protein
VSMIRTREDPFIAIDTLRETAIGRDLPNRRQLVSIINIQKSRLVARIGYERNTAKVITLASDGESEACSRRSQRGTARLVYGDEKIWTVVLSLKNRVKIHKSASLLRELVTGVVHRCVISANLLKICTDRRSMDVSAFQDRPLVPGCAWISCCAYLPNFILNCFDKNILEIVNPIFKMARALHKRSSLLHICGPSIALAPGYSPIILFDGRARPCCSRVLYNSGRTSCHRGNQRDSNSQLPSASRNSPYSSQSLNVVRGLKRGSGR